MATSCACSLYGDWTLCTCSVDREADASPPTGNKRKMSPCALQTTSYSASKMRRQESDSLVFDGTMGGLGPAASRPGSRESCRPGAQQISPRLQDEHMARRAEQQPEMPEPIFRGTGGAKPVTSSVLLHPQGLRRPSTEHALKVLYDEIIPASRALQELDRQSKVCGETIRCHQQAYASLLKESMEMTAAAERRERLLRNDTTPAPTCKAEATTDTEDCHSSTRKLSQSHLHALRHLDRERGWLEWGLTRRRHLIQQESKCFDSVKARHDVLLNVLLSKIDALRAPEDSALGTGPFDGEGEGSAIILNRGPGVALGSAMLCRDPDLVG